MKNTVLSILRHALTFAGGAVIANNPGLDPSNVQGIAGAIVSLVGLVWGARDEWKSERAPRD